MGRDLSYEDSKKIFFLTSRTMNSKLWFIKNRKLEERLLAFLARYKERYQIDLFAFQMMGNHYHLLARFPKMNKAKFTRDFNAIFAKLTATHVKEFGGGKLWARPVRSQSVGNESDVMDRFFYAALNPIGAGLCKKLSEYTTYCSFDDAITGRKRTFRILNREDYNNRKRYNPRLTLAECTTEHTLNYSRLPGYENVPHKQYTKMMRDELEQRRGVLIQKRLAEGKGFATPEELLKLVPGTAPRSTKTSTRHSKRPLILTACMETRRLFLEWYFELRAKFKIASKRFRAGDFGAEFPSGTYRPPMYCTA